MIKTVIKRDGTEEKFDIDKIYNAIRKAYKAANPEASNVAVDYDSAKICECVQKKIEENDNVHVEGIQDIIEHNMMMCSHNMRMNNAAKAFILYRAEHKSIRAGKLATDIIGTYLDKSDWRVFENSNSGYCYASLMNHVSGTMIANYCLENIYSRDVAQAHINGDIHIHDLSAGVVGYCAGWSLKDLLFKGFIGKYGRANAGPAKHLDTALLQAANFLCTLQTEWAGAQAFNSFDTLMAPFIRVDKLTYDEVKQRMQQFVFGLNIASRYGQCPFTNLTFDMACPEDMKEQPVIIGGMPHDEWVYGDFQNEMDMINKAFIEVMIDGDKDHRIFSFPIPTYNITKDFPWDSEVAKLLFKLAGRNGAPYFQNFINSDLDTSDVRSMCPLTPDTEVIVKSAQNGIRITTIHDIVNNITIKGTNYEVWTPEGWRNAKPVKTAATDVYEITLSNGAVVKMGKDHLQPTRYNGTIHADELKIGMWIPFNKTEFGTDLGDYNLGFAVGAYAGDGSKDDKAIVYSLDAREKDDETENKLVKFWRSIGMNTVTSFNKNVRFVRVNGTPVSLIERYIFGNNALNKEFTKEVYNSSVDFKKGLLDGYKATDGSRDKNRLYTSSKNLRDGLCYLLSSLGLKYKKVYEDKREGRLGTNVNYRVDYTSTKRRGNIYDECDMYNYYTIVNIKKVNYTGKYLYCFEVDNKSHLFTLANGLITHNCRLRLDLTEIRKHTGGLFGAGDQTGSIGVVSINIPRIAYECRNLTNFDEKMSKFRNLLDLRLKWAKMALEAKRVEINKNFENGLMPYSSEYLPHKFNRHFSTIGVIGFNEACKMLLGLDMGEKDSISFVLDNLKYMLDKCKEFSCETGNMYNLEAVPGEGLTYRFAKIDKKNCPGIVTAGTDDSPYYTNSSQLPVNYTEDPFEALELQSELQSTYSSGTVLHFFMGECIEDEYLVARFVKKVCENSKIPFFSLTPTFSICPKCGYLVGEHEYCPNHR